MEISQLKEMIDATITENGKGNITGKALNLALTEILTAVEEYVQNNKPAASVTFYLYDNPQTLELTPEHQAANAAAYQLFKTAHMNGESLPAAVLDASGPMRADLGTDGISMIYPIAGTAFVDESAASVTGACGVVITFEGSSLVINEDGTLSEINSSNRS